MKTTTKYGILLPDGSLAKLNVRGNDGAESCGDNSYSLDSSGDIDYLVDDPKLISDVLSYNPEWYNSTADKPSWGRFKQNELRAAKLTVVIEEAPEIAPHPSINLIHVRDIPWSVAKKYAKNDNLPRNEKYVAILTTQHAAEIEPCIGKVTCCPDIYCKRRIVAVWELTDDDDFYDRSKKIFGEFPVSVVIATLTV